MSESGKPPRFVDRRDAGAQLARALARYDGEDAVVYALPRGGVVVADEVARQLELSLSLLVVQAILRVREDR